MNEQFLQLVGNLNYSLKGVQTLIQHNVAGIKDVSFSLDQIRTSLEEINISINTYQSAVTNQPWFNFFIGSIVTLAATLMIDHIKNKRAQKEHLYYLQRVIVDQADLLICSKRILENFVNIKLTTFVKNISLNPDVAYSAQSIIFPMFPVRPLPADVNKIMSSSGYIDSKISNVYSLSEIYPHTINQMRVQFSDILSVNKEVVFGKLNTPQVQKKLFIENILEFKRVVREELLMMDVTMYLRKLIEILVVVEMRSGMSTFSWGIKFDPFWKFYITKKLYLEAKRELMETMDRYFDTLTNERLEKIERKIAEDGRDSQKSKEKNESGTFSLFN